MPSESLAGKFPVFSTAGAACGISLWWFSANAEWNIPNSASTKFEIGSITKPFTAILIMQLEREGRLALEDSICSYVETCPAKWQPITLHHLLSQTSGIFNLTSTGEEWNSL